MLYVFRSSVFTDWSHWNFWKLIKALIKDNPLFRGTSTPKHKRCGVKACPEGAGRRVPRTNGKEEMWQKRKNPIWWTNWSPCARGEASSFNPRRSTVGSLAVGTTVPLVWRWRKTSETDSPPCSVSGGCLCCNTGFFFWNSLSFWKGGFPIFRKYLR